MQGLLPYPSNPLGFESSPLDQCAADADILFNPNNPNYIGAAPSQFRQLIVNEIAQEYNAGRPASEQLTTDARINAYFNSNYQIIARVIPGDG
ncbi:MAG: hypothetical protein MUC85_13870, partial [Anaerolineales bacterium]|nr:hypothetical protein [Anaerolineales bacterium]